MQPGLDRVRANSLRVEARHLGFLRMSAAGECNGRCREQQSDKRFFGRGHVIYSGIHRFDTGLIVSSGRAVHRKDFRLVRGCQFVRSLHSTGKSLRPKRPDENWGGDEVKLRSLLGFAPGKPRYAKLQHDPSTANLSENPPGALEQIDVSAPARQILPV